MYSIFNEIKVWYNRIRGYTGLENTLTGVLNENIPGASPLFSPKCHRFLQKKKYKFTVNPHEFCLQFFILFSISLK